MFAGLLLGINVSQWFRLRNQQQFYEGLLERQEQRHEERIKNIGRQLVHVKKRATDVLPVEVNTQNAAE